MNHDRLRSNSHQSTNCFCDSCFRHISTINWHSCKHCGVIDLCQDCYSKRRFPSHERHPDNFQWIDHKLIVETDESEKIRLLNRLSLLEDFFKSDSLKDLPLHIYNHWALKYQSDMETRLRLSSEEYEEMLNAFFVGSEHKVVVSLDGGGIRGYFTLCTLLELSKDGVDLSKLLYHSDVLSGTSTGALILLGWIIGESFEELKKLYYYEEDGWFGKRVSKSLAFNSKNSGLNPFSSDYDNEPLKRKITEFVGDRTLGDLRNFLKHCKLENYNWIDRNKLWQQMRKAPIEEPDGWEHIPDVSFNSYDILTSKIKVFSTRKPKYDEIKIFDAVVGSTSAPPYFKTHKFDGKVNGDDEKFELIDGGFWANDPELVSVMRSLAYNGPGCTYRLISIGCGVAKTKYTISNGGKYSWAQNGIHNLFMESTLDFIEKTTNLLSNTLPNFSRFKFNIIIDGQANIDDLKFPKDIESRKNGIRSFIGYDDLANFISDSLKMITKESYDVDSEDLKNKKRVKIIKQLSKTPKKRRLSGG